MLSQTFRARLGEAITRLAERGQPFTYWWRDDDAQRDTASLGRLVALSGATRTPLVLAVIPDGAHASLADVARQAAHVHVWQHGYAHTNHAPAGVKKMELGGHRAMSTIMAELDAGRRALQALLGECFDTVLVPPWNRIDAAVIARLREAGLDRISAFGIAPPCGLAATGVRCANTHVDVIDWRGTRGFTGEDAVLAQLLAHIDARMCGRARASEATGLLTHHLVHDAATWAFLEAVATWLHDHANAHALAPEQLFDSA